MSLLDGAVENEKSPPPMDAKKLTGIVLEGPQITPRACDTSYVGLFHGRFLACPFICHGVLVWVRSRRGGTHGSQPVCQRTLQHVNLLSFSAAWGGRVGITSLPHDRWSKHETAKKMKK